MMRMLFFVFLLLFFVAPLASGQENASNGTEEEGLVCDRDTYVCPGGGVLLRDPALNCSFPECPELNAECVDFCGDGFCQKEDCLGQPGCPCYETVESCSEDCSQDGVAGGVVQGFVGGGNMKYFWIVLSIIGACLFIYIGLNFLKWLFWILAILMVVLTVIFWMIL